MTSTNFRLVLSVTGLLMSSGCATPSTTPTFPKPLPAACKVRCELPPRPENPRSRWEEAMLDWAFDCRSLHDECVEGVK